MDEDNDREYGIEDDNEDDINRCVGDGYTSDPELMSGKRNYKFGD